jgi:large subunit ribosomal protein L15
MRLNTLKPAIGAKKDAKRLGRGIGSGKGKTCGCGHKGQTARSGYSKKIGFEGGQMPLQRRVPKFGFNSLEANARAEIRLNELQSLSAKNKVIDIDVLRKENLITSNVKNVKVILSGKLENAVTIKGLKATSGARKAIEMVGGKIE